MSADGEAARRAMQDALREDAASYLTNEAFELGVDRVLVRLWIAGFVLTSRELASEPPPDPPRAGLAS